MGDAYVENGFWVDLGIYLEHFGAAKLDEFNSHAVFEMMFEDDDYDRLRNKFGYKMKILMLMNCITPVKPHGIPILVIIAWNMKAIM